MDGMLQPPSATAFDAAASILSLLVYLGVALDAIRRAPGDPRARTFLVIALTGAVPYALSPLQWWKGNSVYTPAVIALTAVAFTIGGIALFHFTQVFPRRRPWIVRHAAWLAAAYVLIPPPVAVISWILASLLAPPVPPGADPMAATSIELGLLVLALIPVLIVVAVVLPLAGVMSLYRSWQEAKPDARAGDRAATLWMLISQLGGGVLAVLVIPMLHLVGIGPPWSLVIAALTYAFALLLPIAVAFYGINTSA